MKRKIYVIGGDIGYANWMEGEIVHDMHESNLVVLTGGADVDPRVYQKKPHPTTRPNPFRDKEEILELTDAVAANKHIIGICRGAQLLCAMAGGILVQDQHHPFSHEIHVFDKPTDDTITVTSDHHQRQYPWKMAPNLFKVLGWCQLSPFAWGEPGEDLNSLPEVENCYYPKIKALGIQSHPEWMDLKHPSIAYFRQLLDKHMENQL